MSEAELDELLLDLIARSPRELKSLLVTQARRSTQSIRRLVLQFSEPIRHRIYELLAPQQAIYIRQTEETWRNAAKAVPGLSKPRFEEALAQAIYAYLLSSPSVVFDREVFIKSITQFLEIKVSEPLAPLYAVLPKEDSSETLKSLEAFDFVKEGKLYGVEIKRISRWLPGLTLFKSSIPERQRIQVIGDLLLEEHPHLLYRLFQEVAFAENDVFIRELIAYLVVRKRTKFIHFLLQPELKSPPEAVLPVVKRAAIHILKNSPDLVRRVIFEENWASGPEFLETPAFRIWQTLIALSPTPMRRQLIQSKKRRRALKKLLATLPTSSKPAFFAWLEPVINRPVRIWMEELQSKIPELKAVYTSAPAQITTLYSILLDYGLKSSPSVSEAQSFLQELKEEVVKSNLTSALIEEVKNIPLPRVPEDLPEEVEIWEKKQIEAAEEEKRAAQEEAEEESERLEAEERETEKETTDPAEEGGEEPEGEEDQPTKKPKKPKKKDWKTDEMEVETGVSISAKMDYIIHYFELGEIPWWAESWSSKRINPILETLLTSNKPEILDRLKQLITQTRSISKARVIVQRILAEVSEPVVQKMIQVIFPNYSGFVETLVLAFTAYYEAGRRFSLPSSKPSAYIFRWEPVLRSIVGREESAIEAPNLLTRAIREIAKQFNRPIAEVSAQIRTLALEAALGGQTRFTPLTQMLLPGGLPEVPEDPEIPDTIDSETGLVIPGVEAPEEPTEVETEAPKEEVTEEPIESTEEGPEVDAEDVPTLEEAVEAEEGEAEDAEEAIVTEEDSTGKEQPVDKPSIEEEAAEEIAAKTETPEDTPEEPTFTEDTSTEETTDPAQPTKEDQTPETRKPKKGIPDSLEPAELDESLEGSGIELPRRN